MITGVHAMFYTEEPEATRTFLRDKLGFPSTDVGDGWLIFDLPEAELGCHPPNPAEGAPAGTHDISFYCDEIHGTVAELRSRVHRPRRGSRLRPGHTLPDARRRGGAAVPAAVHEAAGAGLRRAAAG
jgi:catechol 2,3-dioxygenase-like lactoylglutathione lyase family enzyme